MPDAVLPLAELVENGRQHLSELTQCLNSCLGTGWELQLREATAWSEADAARAAISGAGLFLSFPCAESGGYLVAIPETLPLPGWYRDPDETENSRLQTLAFEWAFQWLPEDYQDCEASTVRSLDLQTALQWAEPFPDAEVVEICPNSSADTPVDAAESDGEATAETAPVAETIAPVGSLWLIGPVKHPPQANTEEIEPPERSDVAESFTSETATAESISESADSTEGAETLAADRAEEIVNRVRRLLPLEVQVSVRLAEMKIELTQLINLCPGTLLVFPKSCDDLLDLYVNNQLYAQGEAVKIGEKFGLKVNEVGTVRQRQSGIFSL